MMARLAALRAWLYRRRFVALHHAVLAMTIAALMLAAGKTSVVQDLDILTRLFLSAGHTLYLSAIDGSVPRPGAGDRPPVLIVPDIPDQAFNHACGPGEFLAEIIRAVADRKPRLLVLDLNLAAPFDAATPADTAPPCQQMLGGQTSYEMPATFGRVTLDAVRYAAIAKHVRVVLRAPDLPPSAAAFAGVTARTPMGQASRRPADRAAALRLDWIREACAINGVALGTGLDQFSSAVYAPKKPYVGNVAANVAAHVAAKSDPDIGSAGDLCAIFRPFFNNKDSVISDPAVFDLLGDALSVPDLGHSATLDLHYYDTGAQYRGLRWLPVASLAATLAPKRLGIDLGSPAVFIGDGYGIRQSLAPQPVNDTDIHAAMFYSDLHRPFTLPPVLDFLLEVVLGIVLGFLFSWSWGIVARAAERMQHISIANFRAKAIAFCWARFHLLWNLVLLALVIAGAFYLLDALFSWGAWINPLPVILGMALKGLINSRRHQHGHAPQSFIELIDMHPDVAWEVPAIVAALSIAWLLS